jgi:thioester reductase-like protein
MSVSSALAGAHLVATGTTGFVGKVWLTHLLAHAPQIGRVTLLVRGGAPRMARIVETNPAFRPLRRMHGAGLDAFLSARLEVLDADLAKPRLGLDRTTWERLARTADAVVHIAGLTDFMGDPAENVPANVDAAAHIADLAEATRARRLLHVSTCFVAGIADGDVPEALVPGVAPSGARLDVDVERAALADIIAAGGRRRDRVQAAAERAATLGWPNTYTYTKGLAEHLLARRDLRVATVRPSVVECARTWPLPGWNEGLNTAAPLMYLCGTGIGSMPCAGDHAFDVVPVDAVARWMTVVLADLLSAPQGSGQGEGVWQLATSGLNPLTFQRTFELTALAARRRSREPGFTLIDQLLASADMTPDPVDRPGLLDPGRLRLLAELAHSYADNYSVRSALPRPLRALGGPVDASLRRAAPGLEKQAAFLKKLQRMLRAYRPFIHDFDWRFRADRIHARMDSLPPEDGAFHDELQTLDWRRYWTEVQYPGCRTWSFPLMRGKPAPADIAPATPVTLQAAADDARGAA